jgi:hypothetical protein
VISIERIGARPTKMPLQAFTTLRFLNMLVPERLVGRETPRSSNATSQMMSIGETVQCEAIYP